MKTGADRLPASKRSGRVIRRNSPTVAGAAPELFFDIVAVSETHRLPVSSLGRTPSGHLKQRRRNYRNIDGVSRKGKAAVDVQLVEAEM